MTDEQLGPGTQSAHEAAPHEAPPRDAVSGTDGGEGQAAGRLRLGRWLQVGVWGVAAVLVIGVAVLSQTRRGQRLVLDRVLELARGSLAGELVVREVHSRTLVTGMTLQGVRLDAEGGRRFLAADSVVLRYSPFSLLLGTPRVRSTTIHGLDLEISRYPGDEFLNVSRILASGPEPDSAAPSRPLTIGLGRISVRRGVIEVLTPASDATLGRTVPAPGGGALRRMAFDIDDLDLEETMLRPGGAVVVDARLASLTASIGLLESPIVIREAFGDLSFGVRGLEVSRASIRLPGTLTHGDVRFGPERPGAPWAFAAELSSEGWGDLADLQWIDPRIPSGSFRGGVAVRAEDLLEIELRGLEAQLEASHFTVSGRADFGDELVLRALRVTANPLAASRLEPWIGRKLPVDGFLSGQVTFSGTAANLQTTGRLTLVPAGMGGSATTADFSGTIHGGADLGATALEVRLDPLNYRLLEGLWMGARALGTGSARLAVNGRADDGLRVTADVSVAPDASSASRWVGRGDFRREVGGEWTTEVSGDLAPLALPLLDRIWPGLELGGAISGPVRFAGPLSDLRVGVDLAVGEGRLAFDGTIDLQDPGSAYRLAGDAEGLLLSDFTTRLPAPSVFSGSVSVEGRGFAPDSLEGVASLVVRASRLGAARVDSATAVLRASAGVLTADTLDLHMSGARVAGSGSLGLTPGTYGEASLVFSVASLLELRPIFMGDSLLVRDELNPLEQDLLRVRGIEPDTLPDALDIRMAGAAEGTADVRGRVGDFELDLLFEMVDAAYGHDAVDSASVSLSAGGLPATLGDWTVSANARGVAWAGRQFQMVDLVGVMSQRRGQGTLEIQRRRNERYFLTGGFALDSIGGYADLRETSIQINDRTWVLSFPTRVAWTVSSVSIDSLEITNLGDDPMRVTAAGTLTRGGESDFRLKSEGFHIEQATQIMQREDLDVSGHIDLDLTVLGPSERPVIQALFEIEDPRYGDIQISRLSGSLQYEDRSSRFRIEGFNQDRTVLTATGVLPFDLALTDVEQRALSEPMDARVTADSLDAAVALGYLSALEDVRGMLSADFRIGGTSQDPQPSGTVRLADGAWTLEALGVRHTGVTGEVLLNPDRTLTVKLSTTRSGTSTVTGVVTMDEISDPDLDLVVTFDRFLAVDRRDMVSTISGEFTLGGSYRLPVAEGTLRVDEGTLFVEEFARASGVVDLSDPTLYADGFAVDTTVFVSQPLLAGLRNPFLDNLRVDIDMSVPRDMWLRSRDMNVEMGGDLLVRYDRRQGDLVLVGELQALRGSYLVLGRTFEVEGGTVSFIGQPGVNPSLDIQARTRIRRQRGDPLEVQATVVGTLIQPLVTLSSEEVGLAQSDLISFLVFGRSSGELGAGGAGLGGRLGDDLTSGASTLAAGALANQVGAALAQPLGLDYLAVTQGDVPVNANFASNFLRSAQVEVGRYLGDDVFLVLVLSRPNEQTPTDQGTGVNFLRGVRVEWALTDNTFVEGFIEDRFLRSGTGGLGAAGLGGAQVLGVLVFREWGYGSQQ